MTESQIYKSLWYCVTLVPEVFLGFSSFREASRTTKLTTRKDVWAFLAYSTDVNDHKTNLKVRFFKKIQD